jgi:hypothetical protein
MFPPESQICGIKYFLNRVCGIVYRITRDMTVILDPFCLRCNATKNELRACRVSPEVKRRQRSPMFDVRERQCLGCYRRLFVVVGKRNTLL